MIDKEKDTPHTDLRFGFLKVGRIRVNPEVHAAIFELDSGIGMGCGII